MSEALTPLLQFQRFFLPGLFALVVWAVWRTVYHRDLAVGLVLYLGLVVIVDGYLNSGIYLPGLQQGSIRYSELCALLLLTRRPPAPAASAPRRTILLLAGLYFALLFIAALRTDPLMAGVFEFRRLIVPQIVSLLVAVRGIGGPEGYRRFLFHLTALALVIGLFSFWDVFFDRTLIKSEMLFKPEYWMNRKQGRFGSFFLNPNFLGAFTVLVFPASFIRTLSDREPWRRVYLWIGLLSLIFSLVETQSRGPLLAFVVALLALVLMPGGGQSRKRRLCFLALFALVLSLFMPGFFLRAVARFDTVQTESSVEKVSRKAVWAYTQRIIADHPLAGVGFGERQFLQVMEDYGFSDEYGAASLDNPHNSYLQAAVYAGIPALAAFLLANGLLLRNAVRSFRRGGDGQPPVVFGFAVGIAGFLVAIYPDMQLFTPNVAPVYWVFFGLLLSLAAAVPGGEPA